MKRERLTESYVRRKMVQKSPSSKETGLILYLDLDDKSPSDLYVCPRAAFLMNGGVWGDFSTAFFSNTPVTVNITCQLPSCDKRVRLTHSVP